MSKFILKTIPWLIAIQFVSVAFMSQSAEAIPAFARKYDATCSTCHTAWPLLNATGRNFKENGYQFAQDEEAQSVLSDFLKLDSTFPISAVIKARPYDKKKDKDHKNRAIHEFEIMVAGRIGDKLSAFFELEAEDETGFEAEMFGWVTYHHSKMFNVQMSYAGLNEVDPYDTMSGKRRMQRDRNPVIDQKYGLADNKLRDPRQTVSVYGRPTEKLFYTVGYSGPAKDAEGVDANNFHGRVAFDVTPEIMIGVFGLWGDVDDREYTRFGVDTQMQFDPFIFKAAYLDTKDDDLLPADPEMDSKAWYVEATYIGGDGGRPMFVPSIRYGQYDKWASAGVLDGEYSEMNFNLSYYMTENSRIYAEYWKQMDTPSGYEGDRITVQLEFGF